MAVSTGSSPKSAMALVALVFSVLAVVAGEFEKDAIVTDGAPPSGASMRMQAAQRSASLQLIAGGSAWLSPVAGVELLCLLGLLTFGIMGVVGRLKWAASSDPHGCAPTCIVTNGKFPRYRDLIGNTPLIDISQMLSEKARSRNIRLLAKAEFLNPGFSMKDRIVCAILDSAEERGLLVRGTSSESHAMKQQTVVAASSGNTGASVAMQCGMRGYRAVILTNSKCSQEKMDAIRAYGADLRVVPEGTCYMEEEFRLAKANPDWFSVNQYDNLDNPLAHYQTTGPEIWAQTAGEVTHFLAAGSTGGTISGTGRFLKEQNPEVKVVLADPVGSVFYEAWKSGDSASAKPTGKFLVEGVGKNNVPGAMNLGLVDDIIRVSDTDAFATCRELAVKEGLCCGGSTGLNVRAAVQLAEGIVEENALVVTILCDLGVKYLSKVYNHQWLKENNVLGATGGTTVDERLSGA